MKILVVNDDGIKAEGISRLAKMAKELGEVYVVAPANQCSAMSHRITVHGELLVKPEEFPVEGVKAYSVSGTPADCVKVALMHLLPEKPDIVFSGINHGYNAGFDILYSGTVGAAMEALANGIPAIAFSSEMNGVYDVVEEHILPVTRELLGQPISSNEIWNVNFPGCALSELKGILKERKVAQVQFYSDGHLRKELGDGAFSLELNGVPVDGADEGTDVDAVLKNYISIGKIRNNIIEV